MKLNPLLLAYVFIPLSACAGADTTLAGMIPTSDSPAFQRDVSVDAGVSVEIKTTTTTEAIEGETLTREVEAYRYIDECGVEQIVYEHQIEYTPTTYNTTSQTDAIVSNHQRVNARLGNDVLVYGARNNGDFALGVAAKNSVFAGSVGISPVNGELQGAVAVSPIKNLAVYAEYEREAMNYGVQYQAGDVAFQAYTRPDQQAYGFGVAINIGSNPAPAKREVAEQPVDYDTPGMPVIVEEAPAKPTVPVKPVKIRSRG